MAQLYRELATAIVALRNCERSGNAQWLDKWTARIKDIMDTAPSGSGIDSGTKLDEDKSHGTKLVFTTGFHHMNEAGSYDGWTHHTVTVTPTFDGIDVRISGRDRNMIKDYLGDVFHGWLTDNFETKGQQHET